MGLLVHWASLLEGVEVERLGTVWLAAAAKWLALAVADRSAVGRNRVRRFLELIEANTTSVAELLNRTSSADGIIFCSRSATSISSSHCAAQCVPSLACAPMTSAMPAGACP